MLPKRLLFLAIAAFFAATFLLSGVSRAPVAQATVTPPLVVTDPDLNSGDNTNVTITADSSDGILRISLIDLDATSIAILSVVNCGGCDEQGTVDVTVPYTIDINTDDGDFPAGPTDVLINVAVACDTDDSFIIRASQDGDLDPVDAVINCTAVDGMAIIGDLLLIIDATPNVLFCGGTSILHGELRDLFGNVLSNAAFHFATDIGLIEHIDKDSAHITLEAGMGTANVTVTVALPDPDDDTNALTSNIILQNYCAENLAAVVVTANPNVVPCAGGTVQLSASGRDPAGHVIKGLGYHFTTNAGELEVGPPPTAEAEQQFATLTVLPDMFWPTDVSGAEAITVLVSVGSDIGTIEGQSTIYRHCPTSQEKPGTISLKSSSPTVFCGGKVFIGASVIDQKGNTPPDGTPIEFIADVGELIPPNPTTVGGSLNIVYQALPGSRGLARITAAGGSAYGYIDLEVKCETSTGSTQGVAGANANVSACNPIGGIICITPPNTGDAGLIDKP